LEWDRLAFKSGENGDEFALCLTSLRQRMEQYGDYDITEERAIAKFSSELPAAQNHHPNDA
jgi:hypothetical protein